MEKKTAQTCISSAHRTAEAIVSLRSGLSEAEQDALYARVFIGLLEDNVGSMDITELLDALARR